MRQIYRDIISNGTTGVSDNSGENAKGENLGLIAGAELYQMVELFPEMLEMLKKLHKSCLNHRGGKRRKLGELIAKAEGGE